MVRFVYEEPSIITQSYARRKYPLPKRCKVDSSIVQQAKRFEPEEDHASEYIQRASVPQKRPKYEDEGSDSDLVKKLMFHDDPCDRCASKRLRCEGGPARACNTCFRSKSACSKARKIRKCNVPAQAGPSHIQSPASEDIEFLRDDTKTIAAVQSLTDKQAKNYCSGELLKLHSRLLAVQSQMRASEAEFREFYGMLDGVVEVIDKIDR